MTDENNGIRYTTKEAIENLRAEMMSEFGEVKNDIRGVKTDVADLKEFRTSMRDAVKIIAFIITIAVAISGSLLYSGILK